MFWLPISRLDFLLSNNDIKIFYPFLNPLSYGKTRYEKKEKEILDYTQHFCVVDIPEAVSGNWQYPSYPDCYLPHCSEEFTPIRFQSKQKKLRKMSLCEE